MIFTCIFLSVSKRENEQNPYRLPCGERVVSQERTLDSAYTRRRLITREFHIVKIIILHVVRQFHNINSYHYKIKIQISSSEMVSNHKVVLYKFKLGTYIFLFVSYNSLKGAH